MDVDLDAVGPARAWAAAVGAVLVAVVGGSLAFPRQVYAGFVWRYFWGPVYADANGAYCAVWNDGARDLMATELACDAAARDGIVAVRGYNTFNEIGYILILALALVGVIFLVRRLGVARSPGFFFALLPYVFFGGALRVIEDVIDAARFEGISPFLEYPLNALLISPVIYFTVFGFTLAVLGACLRAQRAGYVERYERPLFAVGVVVLVANLGVLSALAATTSYVEFFPIVTVLTLGVATLSTGAAWWAIDRYAPVVMEGTGYIGVVVIWAHAVDGAANVLLMDWGEALGVGAYVPKHPVNAGIASVTEGALEFLAVTLGLAADAITSVTGTVWPFLPVKVVAAAAAVWLFNEEVIEESPRYSLLLLVAVVAVGLGPGTRDMLRATFGV
jgi:uncharacterized membrane protein